MLRLLRLLLLLWQMLLMMRAQITDYRNLHPWYRSSFLRCVRLSALGPSRTRFGFRSPFRRSLADQQFLALGDFPRKLGRRCW